MYFFLYTLSVFWKRPNFGAEAERSNFLFYDLSLKTDLDVVMLSYMWYNMKCIIAKNGRSFISEKQSKDDGLVLTLNL